METLISVLLSSLKAHPAMQLCDAVKLLYQNEFGCHHLMTDPEKMKADLFAELEKTAPDPEIPLTEPIGGGMVRVNLAAWKRENRSPEELKQLVFATASAEIGSPERFSEKLEVLLSLAEKKLLPYSYEETASYIESYRAAGMPVPTHSPAYKAAYHPAYRVVREEFVKN